MKCSKCSYECENNKFCPNCGTPTNQNIQGDVQNSTSFVDINTTTINNSEIQPVQTEVGTAGQSQPVVQQQTVAPVVQPVQPVAPVVPIQPVNQVVQPQPVVQPVQQAQPAVQLVQPIVQPVAPEQPVVQQQVPPKKKSNVGLLLIIVLLVIAVVGGIIFAGSKLKSAITTNSPTNEQPVSESSAPKTKTFMVYIVGADLETESAAASKDLAEMLDSHIDENVNLLIYTGGANKWWNKIVNSNENAIYEVEYDQITKVQQYTTKNMLSPATLTEFIDYVYDNYETESYSLILWDHGGGPIVGYGVDEVSNTKLMSLDEIKTGISNSKLLEDKKLDILGFDACLMASIEVASAFTDVANYMIASQEIEPGGGWDYHFLENITSNTSIEEIGKNIIDTYVDYYKDPKEIGYNYEPDLTLSMINLSKINVLEEKIDSSFDGLGSNISINNYSKISQRVNKTTKYSESDGYDLLDLNGFIKNMSKEYPDLSDISELINDAVVYKKGNIDGSSGLSIYFPNNKQTISVLLPKYQNLDFSENYKTFINEYIRYKTGAALVSSKTTSLSPTLTESNELSATLPEDLSNNYQSAYYIVYKKEGDNAYLPVLRSDDVNINGNVISTKPNQKQLIITNKEKTIKYTATVIKDKDGEEYTKYKVIATLQKIGSDDKEEVCAQDPDSSECFKAKVELKLENVYLYYKVYDDGRKPELYDIKPFDSESELAPKISFDLNFWTHICFMSSNYQLYDASGNLLEDWISNGTISGYEFTIDEGYEISFEEWDKEHEYYYQFMVVDTQDNVHQLPLIKSN